MSKDSSNNPDKESKQERTNSTINLADALNPGIPWRD